MAATYNISDWIWVPDEEELILPAKIMSQFKAGEKGNVEVHRFDPLSGRNIVEQRVLNAKATKNLERMDPNSTAGIENMVNLRALSENSILHNLRLRFFENNIYTSVGTILISVNPFKLLPLYTAEKLESYKEQGYRNLPPHVYSIADMSYTDMTSNAKDQSCIVSGESGAGKTEATKIFLQYIAEVSSQASKQKKAKDDSKLDPSTVSLQDQILKANPLMEAFGNAKTVRNNNSSRFGKWIEISFNNKKGTIAGGKIVQYLLEKSRVVTQQKNERNYHIFYNLCAGALMDSEVRKKFSITDARDYNYLNGSEESIYVDGINDEGDWEDVLSSMSIVGISLQDQDDIIRTLAGILHLGNLDFEKQDGAEETSVIKNVEMLNLTANQLGTSAEALKNALTTQKINVGVEITQRNLNVNLARDTRDALAKELYSRMFESLISRINTSFAKNQSKDIAQDKSIIGVLDIFGFEVFDHNSFEQLCINYCNEKLQLHFNNHIFKLEENLYASEGIDVSKITFKDNIPTINLFEDRKEGIFKTVDDTMFLPSAKDKDGKFLKTITNLQKKHPNFKGPGVKTNYERASFTVVHYAGAVMYNVTGFMEKNSDKLSPDLGDLISASSIKFVAALIVKEEETQDKRKTNIRNSKTRIVKRNKDSSLGSKFKQQLNELMNILTNTEPHFIRCIKPNNEKVGGTFTAKLVMEQLRYAGLLEVCRIRKLGYPIRREFKHFLFRYSCLVKELLSSSRNVSQQTVKTLCHALKDMNLLTEGEFQVGKTKVFLRGDQVDRLEARREEALKVQALIVQKVVRGWLEKKKYIGYKKIIKNLIETMERREKDGIKKGIEEYGELPFAGSNRKELAEAKVLLEKMEENLRLINLLEKCIEQRDLNALNSTLKAAEVVEIISNFKGVEITKLVQNAKFLKTQLEQELRAIEEMNQAIRDRDLELISQALAKLSEMGLSEVKEFQQGEVLRAVLEEQERIIKNISEAVTGRDLKALDEALTSANENGLDENEKIIEAKKVYDDLLKEQQAEEQEKILLEKKRREEEHKKKVDKEIEIIREKLKKAVEENEFSHIYELKTTALEMGMERSELDQLLTEVEQLERINETVNSLNAAMEAIGQLLLNKNGITPEDFADLSDVIDKARVHGLTEENAALRKAVLIERKAEQQIEAQEILQKAIDLRDFEALKRAINEADDLNLDLDQLAKARELMKDEGVLKTQNVKNNRQSVKILSPEEDDVDVEVDEMEKRRAQMIEEASHPKHEFKKFFNIRSSGDYVRGIIFNKRKLIDTQLSYQTTVIPKSILNLRKDLNKQALSINKSILGYCGEQSMQFPATLAQDVLDKGMRNAELADEIYIQLCKHLSNNPVPESVARAWQLMCLAVETFSPSQEFEFHLLNFLILSRAKVGLVGNYAQYSLRRLEGMLVRGTSGFLPTLEEILAYKKRPPVLSTIELVDGTALTQEFPIPPHLNVDKVVGICIHFVELKDDRATQFGIYVQEEPETLKQEFLLPESGYSAMRMNQEYELDGIDLPPPPPPISDDGLDSLAETARPLSGNEYIGDVVLGVARKKTKYTLIFKKKLFVTGDDEQSEDNAYKRLMYLQAADEVIRGNVQVIEERDLLLLTAIALNNDLPDNVGFPSSEKQLLDLDLMDYLPFNWASKKKKINWARAIATQRGKVVRKEKANLEQIYVEVVRKMPLWGFNFFFVREKLDGADIICGVRYDGISFFTPKRTLIKKYDFKAIERWGGSSTQFWIVLFNERQRERGHLKVALFTKQARPISNLILDYTRLRQEQQEGQP